MNPQNLPLKGGVGPQSNISRSLPQSAQTFDCRLFGIPSCATHLPLSVTVWRVLLARHMAFSRRTNKFTSLFKVWFICLVVCFSFFQKKLQLPFCFFTFCFKQKHSSKSLLLLHHSFHFFFFLFTYYKKF